MQYITNHIPAFKVMFGIAKHCSAFQQEHQWTGSAMQWGAFDRRAGGLIDSTPATRPLHTPVTIIFTSSSHRPDHLDDRPSGSPSAFSAGSIGLLMLNKKTVKSPSYIPANTIYHQYNLCNLLSLHLHRNIGLDFTLLALLTLCQSTRV